MKTILSLVMLTLLVTALQVQAAPEIYNGIDIGPLVELYGHQVVTLKSSVKIYNWSSNGSQPFWSQERTSDDPAIQRYAESIMNGFWGAYGGDSKGNMYGLGLYGAVDPVATFGYGGGTDAFLLLQMELPIGFRFLDLPETSMLAAGVKLNEVQNIASKFGCPVSTSLDPYFAKGGEGLSQACQGLARRVFSEILKIDGIAYDYTHTPFKDCVSSSAYNQQRAFVITGSAWMKPNLIHFYTHNSRQDTEGRRMIQTLFFTAAQDQVGIGQDQMGPLVNEMVDHPELEIHGSTSTCSGTSCTLAVHLCDAANKCHDVILGPLPRPGGGVMTLAAAQSTSAYGLLWTDMDGQPKSSTTTEWLKANKFACSGTVPYQAPQN